MDTNVGVNEKLFGEVEAFIEADRQQQRSAVVLYGSSTFRLWKNMQLDLCSDSVLNRGFGGACLTDLVYHAARIPSLSTAYQIFLYGGGNDLLGRTSPQQVIDQFEILIDKLYELGSPLNIVVVSILPHPRFDKLLQAIAETNSGLKEKTASASRLLFCDLYGDLLAMPARLRADLFCEDGIHLNGTGYTHIAGVLKPFLAPGHQHESRWPISPAPI